MKHILSFIEIFILLFAVGVIAHAYSEKTSTTDLVTYNMQKTTMLSAVERYEKALVDIGIKFPKVVMAQMVHETNWFTSRIYYENRNYFGMKYNTRGYAIGKHRGHAKYSSYEDSILDYASWQKRVLALAPDVDTDEEYIALLDNLPICKGCRYAEDPNYTQSIRLRMAQLDELKY